MATFSEADRKHIRQMLAGMQGPVRLIYFTQALQCELCEETKKLVEQLVSLSDKLSLQIYNLQIDKEQAARYRIDKVPAIVVEGAKDYGVRMYGFPAGYEIVVLLQSILRVSAGKSDLSPETIAALKELKRPVHIEVFVTPTCPYCPGAAQLAHQLAMESDLITADVVEATEFPELVRHYRVRGVPKTVVNGSASIEGSMPEEDFVAQVLAASSSAENAAPAPAAVHA